MRKIQVLFTTMLALLVLASCDNTEVGESRIIVSLTDSPGDYESVNIDIQSVQIHRTGDGDESGWVDLPNVNAGVYDLLELTNGTEVVLSDGSLPTGTISQMRLVLGDENTLLLEGEPDPIALSTPSAQQSGLKLQINETLELGLTYTFKLDFDAAKSVVQAGNSGKYNLKPVIRVLTEATSGAIAGKVDPAAESVAVHAIQGEDTIATSYAVSDVSEFIIGGLEAGDYNVAFDAGEASEFASSLVENVSVSVGVVTQVETVTLVP